MRSLRPFAGVGVTSILLPPVVPKEEADDDGDDDSLYFYVGTKRGKMKKVTITFVRHDYDDVDVQYENCIIQCIENMIVIMIVVAAIRRPTQYSP